MSEPILSLGQEKDSLDVLLEMDMEEILNHPVIIEVINLSYEGEYSINSHSVYLSSTIAAFFQMRLAEAKCIFSRLLLNIRTFGRDNKNRQTSLNFHIWKKCIEQRQMDETLFMSIVTIFLIVLCYFIQQDAAKVTQYMIEAYGEDIYFQLHILQNSQRRVIDGYCTFTQPYLLGLRRKVEVFDIAMLINCASFFTKLVQTTLTQSLMQSSKLKLSEFGFNAAIFVSSLAYIIKMQYVKNNR